MKFNFDVALKEMDGKPVKTGSKTDDFLLAKDVCTRGLLTPDQQEKDGKKKYDKFVLAQKINNEAKDCELTSEEIVMVKEMIGKIYPPLIVGQMFNLLEEKPMIVLPKKEK